MVMKPNRKTLDGIYIDLKIVLNAISEFENRKLYPDFHPEGMNDDDDELLQQWEDYETFFIMKLAEEKGILKQINPN